MRFEHETTHAQEGEQPQKEPPPPSPEPAKPTEPAFKTGNRYFDEGAVCARSNHENATCFLEKEQRERILQQIDHNISFAHTNYLTALGKARVELLMHKKAGWGFGAELLFNLATAALTGGIGYAATKLATLSVKSFLAAESTATAIAQKAAADEISSRAAEKALTDRFIRQETSVVTQIVNNSSRALKPALKSQFDHFPADVEMKGQFINQLMNHANQLFTSTRDDVFANGDDSAILTMLGGTSPAYLTLDYFTRSVSDLLSRFDSSHIMDVGPLKQGAVTAGTTETVLVVANGRSRFAIVQFGERKDLGRIKGETLHTDGGDYFLGFVDDDLTSVARMAQHKFVGDVKVIDVSKGHNLSRAGALDAWIDGTRAGKKV